MTKFIMKLVLGTLIVVGLGSYGLKKTNGLSYLTTWWSQTSEEAERSIPTKFELDRIRGEIAALDSDISGMIRPIAEYKACIERLGKDIARDQKVLDEQKQTLLAVTTDLEANPKYVTIGTRKIPSAQVRKQLEKDTLLLQKTDLRLKTQQQILMAKEDAFRATQEQMAKVVQKKRDYEVRLAQLEAEEESLKIAKIGSDIQLDTSRTTQIEDALTKIEHRQTVERNQLDMRRAPTVSLFSPTNAGELDLQAIRAFLRGDAAPTPVTVAK